MKGSEKSTNKRTHGATAGEVRKSKAFHKGAISDLEKRNPGKKYEYVGTHKGTHQYRPKQKSRAKLAKGGKVQKAVLGAVIGTGVGMIAGAIKSGSDLKKARVEGKKRIKTREDEGLAIGTTLTDRLDLEYGVIDKEKGILRSEDPAHLGAQMQITEGTEKLEKQQRQYEKGIFEGENLAGTMGNMMAFSSIGNTAGSLVESGVGAVAGKLGDSELLAGSDSNPFEFAKGGRAKLGHKYYEKRKKGGKVGSNKGAVVGGNDPTGTGDTQTGEVEEGTVIIPKVYQAQAMEWKQRYFPDTLDKKADLKQKGNNTVDVALSTGEVMFTPQEAEILAAEGIDVEDYFLDDENQEGVFKCGGRVKMADGGRIYSTNGVKVKGYAYGDVIESEVSDSKNAAAMSIVEAQFADLEQLIIQEIRNDLGEDAEISIEMLGAERNSKQQGTHLKSGASTSTASLHQIGGARDVRVVVNGKKLDKLGIQKYVWPVAEKAGMHHLSKDGFGSKDPWHISVVEEKGDGESFNRYFEKYPEARDSSLVQKALKELSAKKSPSDKEKQLISAIDPSINFSNTQNQKLAGKTEDVASALTSSDGEIRKLLGDYYRDVDGKRTRITDPNEIATIERTYDVSGDITNKGQLMVQKESLNERGSQSENLKYKYDNNNQSDFEDFVNQSRVLAGGKPLFENQIPVDKKDDFLALDFDTRKVPFDQIPSEPKTPINENVKEENRIKGLIDGDNAVSESGGDLATSLNTVSPENKVDNTFTPRVKYRGIEELGIADAKNYSSDNLSIQTKFDDQPGDGPLLDNPNADQGNQAKQAADEEKSKLFGHNTVSALLSGAQILTGAVGLTNQGERPEITTDPMLMGRYTSALSEEQYGISPEERNMMDTDIENKRSDSIRMAKEFTDNPNMALAFINKTNIEAHEATVKIAAIDESIKREKRTRTDALANLVSQDKRNVEQRNLMEFDNIRDSFIGALNTGIENTVGQSRYKDYTSRLWSDALTK